MIDPTQPLSIAEIKIPVNNRRPDGKFAAGNNANPHGRPFKEWTWKDLYKEVAEEMFEVKKKDGTTLRSQFKHLVAKKLFMEALNGNIGAIKELANRMDGMPKQQNELSGSVEIVSHRAPPEKT